MKFFLTLPFLVLFCSCEYQNHEIRTEKYELDCPKDYQLIFTRKTEITDRDTVVNNHLTVLHKTKTRHFDLKQVRSGSGVKYATSNGRYIFWEHQGEAQFGTEDSTYCTCKFPK